MRPHRTLPPHTSRAHDPQSQRSLLLCTTLLLGCSSEGPGVTTPDIQGGFAFEELAPTASSPVTEAQSVALWGELIDNPARPMIAGTLTVTRDGAFAVASDSERDVMYVVDLASRKPSRIALSPEDQPGRVVSGQNSVNAPHVYAVLRQANAIADINLRSAEIERVPTCKAPRGIAYDEAKQLAHVACASGELVSYDVDGWSEQRRVFVASDLRDVELAANKLVLSRYASSEVLIVNELGEVESRGTPQALPACAQSTVAHRLLVRGEDVYLAHQLANAELSWPSTCAVSQVASVLTREPLERFSSLTPVWQSLTSVSRDGSRLGLTHNEGPFAAGWSSSSGPLDLAVGSNGRLVMSLAGNYWVDELATVVTLEPEGEDDSGWARTVRHFRPAGMVTSVALDGHGKWLAFSREPAALYFEDQPSLFMGGASVNNTGFSLLHMNSGTGVSCVSCHPEGGQDDHLWWTANGARLTLPLRGARAPFNWDHSVPDMGTLLAQVLYTQMQYPFSVTGDQASELQHWLSGLPIDDTSFGGEGPVERGSAVFASFEAGCVECHIGTTYTDYAAHDVGTGGVFATPSLWALASRENFLHDGCAATLEDVFGACGGEHQNAQNLKREQVEDLLAFLASL